MSQLTHAINTLLQTVASTQLRDAQLSQPIASACKLENAIELDSLAWLDAQPHFPKFYWQSRDGKEEVVALGQVHTFSDPAPAYNIIKQDQRIWGGKPFSPNDKLNTFFFLPQIELVRVENSWWIKVNIGSNKQDIIDALSAIVSQPNPLADLAAQIESVNHSPDFNGWKSRIDDALYHIKTQQFKKVVLARKSDIRLTTPISATQLLKSSVEKNRDSFHFMLAIDSKSNFIGSTPERLYSRSGRQLETEALAGTTGRGKTEQADQQLANWLINDEKNQTENQYVVDDIVNCLTPHAKLIQVQPQTELVRLRNVQHLKRSIQASLNPDVNGVQLLSVLQPTAAVAGLPRKAAIEYIKQIEPFDRGWYSGSMGYISQQKAEFCVAIRSAVVSSDSLQLYAGAGIVDGSQAEHEWQELDRKSATFLKLFDQKPCSQQTVLERAPV